MDKEQRKAVSTENVKSARDARKEQNEKRYTFLLPFIIKLHNIGASACGIAKALERKGYINEATGKSFCVTLILKYIKRAKIEGVL